jgi:ABC-type Zn uptake system ZnuABC Zn-binding protein ZnuA
MWSKQIVRSTVFVAVVVLAISGALTACGTAPDSAQTETGAGTTVTPETSGQDGAQTAELPPVSAVPLAAGEKLRVVATTNLIADAVRQVGGDHVDLWTLMPPGVDPHSYAATPQDLRTLSQAHVIFANGLGLEEALAPVLESGGDAVVVEVNTGVEPLEDDEEGHSHEGGNPHTWQRVETVQVWVENIEHILSELDPAHAEAYASAAQAYQERLAALDEEIRATVAQIPEANRKLVTDHDTLAYLADEYGFEIIGAVIPSFSTAAAPSAQELAQLQDQLKEAGVPAIFVGTTVNPDLEQQLADDLGIDLVPVYSDSLSDADGPAATYIEMMRYTVNAIAEALR